jgi:hypothetical protein
MADDDPILAALGLKAPGTDRHWSFQVSDIVLTAALFAGGTNPIHKFMDAFPQVYGGVICGSQRHNEMKKFCEVTENGIDKHCLLAVPYDDCRALQCLWNLVSIYNVVWGRYGEKADRFHKL